MRFWFSGGLFHAEATIATCSDLLRIPANVNTDSGDREHLDVPRIGLGGFLAQVFTMGQLFGGFCMGAPLASDAVLFRASINAHGVMLSASDEPEKDRFAFLKAQIIFWLIGAPDGHAKNFSVFIALQGRFRMTPLYDIMSVQPQILASQMTRNNSVWPCQSATSVIIE